MRMKPGVLGAALALGIAGAAQAGESISPDLRCHKIKDPSQKAQYSAMLDSSNAQFPDEACTIKTPAKLLCTPEQTVVNVAPTANGFVTSSNEQFACYKVKCPKATHGVAMNDRFGSRTVTVKATKLLCAPANFSTMLAAVRR